MEPWIGVVGTLLGGLLGGGLTHWTASTRAKADRRWEVNRLIQSKLEAIAEILDDIEFRYRQISGDAMKSVLAAKPLEFKEGRLPTARLNALVTFYAPELSEEKKELDKKLDDFGQSLARTIGNRSLNESERKRLFEQLLRGHQHIEEACRAMSEKAALIARDRLTYEQSRRPFFGRLGRRPPARR